MILFRLAKKIDKRSDENMLPALFFERTLFYVDRIVLFERNQKDTWVSVGKKLKKSRHGLTGIYCIFIQYASYDNKVG